MKPCTLLLLFCLAAATTGFAQADTTVEVTIGTLKDTGHVFVKVENEAQFVGGLPGWQQYLVQNIRMEGVMKAAPKRSKHWQQTAVVQFIVCKDGSLCEIKVVNKVHPEVAKEARRIIATSPNWEPATQNGRTVNAYRKQPITFVVETED